ncbi:hypothetical protein chiPu_0032053, partial [Chiloscyllium punctatum]|nr:hypothetical protein [Chiloscyllium punctatum]
TDQLSIRAKMHRPVRPVGDVVSDKPGADLLLIEPFKLIFGMSCKSGRNKEHAGDPR